MVRQLGMGKGAGARVVLPCALVLECVLSCALALGCTNDAATPATGTGNGGGAGNGGSSNSGSSNGGVAGGNGDAAGSGQDITDLVLTARVTDCAAFEGSYVSTAMDVQRGEEFHGSLVVSVEDDACMFATNSIPNYDFDDGSAPFANEPMAVDETYRVPRNPERATAATELSLAYDNAILANGVKVDLLAAACYGVGNEPLGKEKIGCSDAGTPWRYDPAFAGNDFATDSHYAHTQPDGAYHYHGPPGALYEVEDPSAESATIGFAADGFPIYGPYIEEDGTLREVVSGYTLRSGARTDLPGQGALPPGDYDGTFNDDYEFTGAGDLDECNGMERDGSYGYYVTRAYPWIIRCFAGAADASFRK